MKFGLFVPVRLESRRLPRKALLPLGNTTLTGVVLRNLALFAKKRKNVFGPVLLTDHKAVLEEGMKQEVFGMMTPKVSCGSKRVFFAASKFRCDYYVNIQGDEPFLQTGTLEKFLRKVKSENCIYTMARLLRPGEENERSRVKVVLDKNDDAMYFSRARIPSNAPSSRMLVHLGIYVFPRKMVPLLRKVSESSLRRDEQLEQLDWLYGGFRIKIIRTRYEGFGIDTRKDYILARQKFR